MSRRTKGLLLALVAIVVAAEVGLEAYRLLDRQAIFHEVAQARQAALSPTSTTTTPDDARRWLESNSYHVVIWNPREPRGFIGTEQSSVDGNHLMVTGQKRVRRSGWPLQPTWIDLKFRFTLHGTFEDVQADSSITEFPRVSATAGTPKR